MRKCAVSSQTRNPIREGRIPHSGKPEVVGSTRNAGVLPARQAGSECFFAIHKNLDFQMNSRSVWRSSV